MILVPPFRDSSTPNTPMILVPPFRDSSTPNTPMILVPTVSIGNVPQLAFDLLIHTYDMQLEKALEDEFMYPIAGPQDYAVGQTRSKQGISTPIQLFKHDKFKLIQLRSPHLPGWQRRFLKEVGSELTGPVLVVGSANAGMRTTSLDSPKLVWCTASSLPKDLHESGTFQAAMEEYECQEGLVLYTYEGDNVDNAVEVANAIVKKLGLEKKALVKPASWAKFYGKEAPTSLEDGIYA